MWGGESFTQIGENKVEMVWSCKTQGQEWDTWECDGAGGGRKKASTVGRPKKIQSKVVKEDMKKLNIMEDMEEDGEQWR